MGFWVLGLGCRVRVRVGVRVILECAHHVLDELVRGGDIGEIWGRYRGDTGAHHVLDELVRGGVAEAELGQGGVEALGVLLLENLEPVARPPLGVVLLEELRRVVESPVDQLHLLRRRGGVGVGGLRLGLGLG